MQKFWKKSLCWISLLDNIKDFLKIHLKRAKYLSPLLRFKDNLSKALIKVQNGFLIWNKNKSVRAQCPLLKKFNDLVDPLLIHYFPIQAALTATNFAAVIFTIFRKNLPVNVHFFRGIQKSFPRTRKTTTTTNKPSLRPRQRSIAVKNR